VGDGKSQNNISHNIGLKIEVELKKIEVEGNSILGCKLQFLLK